jgi:hypothetical protein
MVERVRCAASAGKACAVQTPVQTSGPVRFGDLAGALVVRHRDRARGRSDRCSPSTSRRSGSQPAPFVRQPVSASD